ncbi:MAG: mechanosensitive ion channel [Capnocytophaga sp.]|nr:mechanosensitive ion channel [Capnocytophaga sp.]
MGEISAKNLEQFIEKWIADFIGFIPTLIGAIILYVIGRYAILFVLKILTSIMVKREIDLSLQSFLRQVIRWMLYITLFLIIIQILGFPASSFIAVLGTAGVAIGLALQGSLSNFAGGIMILLFKPFKIGDSIEAKGQRGTVKDIGLFATTLNKFNHEEVIIPNGPLFNDNIINYSRETKRRVKLLVGIGYSSDIKTAKEIMLKIATDDPRSHTEPAPTVVVEELADSSVNISVRFWCDNADYSNCLFDATEAVKLQFDQAGIEIPFPQRDVHIKQG